MPAPSVHHGKCEYLKRDGKVCARGCIGERCFAHRNSKQRVLCPVCGKSTNSVSGFCPCTTIGTNLRLRETRLQKAARELLDRDMQTLLESRKMTPPQVDMVLADVERIAAGAIEKCEVDATVYVKRAQLVSRAGKRCVLLTLASTSDDKPVFETSRVFGASEDAEGELSRELCESLKLCQTIT